MTLVDQEPKGGWVVVGACFGALAVIFGVSYSFAAFFESYAREFSASRADVSLVFGVSGLLYFLAGAGGGLLADRHGPRIVTSAGMLCIAAALWVSSQATSLVHIVLAQGVGVGLGIALVVIARKQDAPRRTMDIDSAGSSGAREQWIYGAGI